MEEITQKEILDARVGDITFPCGIVKPKQDKPFEGGCGEPVGALDGYRCSDCQAMFHRDCARRHFKQAPLEEELKRIDEIEKLTHHLVGEDKQDELTGAVFKLVEIEGKRIKEEVREAWNKCLKKRGGTEEDYEELVQEFDNFIKCL